MGTGWERSMGGVTREAELPPVQFDEEEYENTAVPTRTRACWARSMHEIAANLPSSEELAD
jgi:hypothetical protein